MPATFYNHTGAPTAYTDDDVHVYGFDGRPLAFIDETSLYSYSGTHLGWYDGDWVRDHHGACAFFTEHATGGGPAKPAKFAKPAKGAKFAKPAKGAKQSKPARPAKTLAWSRHSSLSFFAR